MKGRILSKSSFIRGRQCGKSLWLYFYQPALREKPDDLRRSLFQRGHKVGFFARQLFPGGQDASPSSPSRWAESVALTRQYMDAGYKVIYEAAFEHNRCLAFADLLVRTEEGWHAYEVKSSLRVTEVHLMDAAFQYHVIQGSGCLLSGFSLVHPNPDFVHHGEITPHEFFLLHDITEQILKRQVEVFQGVSNFKQMLESEQMPQQKVGPHCQSPYPCDFRSYCWGRMHAFHILNLPAFSIQEASGLFNAGVRDIRDIPHEEPLSDFHRGIIHAHRTNTNLVDTKTLSNWLNKIVYPIAFFDLEMFMPPIPMYRGTRPFEHLPFAYSLIKLAKPEAEKEYFFFMADAGEDPREVISRRLLSDLDGIRTLIVFDSSQEHAVFRKLGALFPDTKPFMEDLCRRTADLADLFVSKKIYFPSMGNSFSLKSLSSIAGVNMEHLKINNGYDASAAYESLHEQGDLFHQTEVREELTRYSRADTEMISGVFQKLHELHRGSDSTNLD